MSETIQAKGQCLCGSVNVIASAMSKSFGVCHCSMCRQWSGGPYFAIEAGSDVQFEGQESLATYDSSEWAKRGFCKQCGSNLFYYLKPKDQYYLAGGIMNGFEDLAFDHQIFVDEQPNNYHFSEETVKLTGQQVFEQASS